MTSGARAAVRAVVVTVVATLVLALATVRLLATDSLTLVGAVAFGTTLGAGVLAVVVAARRAPREAGPAAALAAGATLALPAVVTLLGGGLVVGSLQLGAAVLGPLLGLLLTRARAAHR